MAAKKLIYLVEDDFGIIDVYKMGMEKIGKFKVEMFPTCSKIRERIDGLNNKKFKKPDLLLLDLIMPECNGIEILQEIKKGKETKDIPVLVFTNYGNEEFKKIGYELKAEEYYIKTEITPIQLVELVKKRLKKK